MCTHVLFFPIDERTQFSSRANGRGSDRNGCQAETGKKQDGDEVPKWEAQCIGSWPIHLIRQLKRDRTSEAWADRVLDRSR